MEIETDEIDFYVDLRSKSSNGDLPERRDSHISEISAVSFRDFGSFHVTENEDDGLNFTGLPLFGRSSEIRALQECYDQVALQKKSNVCLISGISGTGKTTLVNCALRDYVFMKSGLYVEGKFVESGAYFFSAIVTAFTDLCDLIAQSDELKNIQENLLKDFEPQDIKFMSRLISNFTYVTGPVESSDSFDATDDVGGNNSKALVRFKLLCASFLKALKGTPIVLVIDDLHLADESSLGVLQHFVSVMDTLNVLLVFLYQPDKFDITKMGIDQETFGKAHQMSCECLDRKGLNDLVSFLLQTNPTKTTSLSEIVLQKTAGNPFHVICYMESLFSKHLLTHNTVDADNPYQWDSAKIQSETDVTENVSKLLREKIGKLPGRLQSILQLVAYIGHTFHFDILLSMLYAERQKYESPEISEVLLRERLTTALTIAVNEGIIEKTKPEVYKFSSDQIHIMLHDTIPEGSARERMHVRIGNHLYKLVKAKLGDPTLLLLAVDNLNKGKRQLTSDLQKATLVQLNVEASKVAMSRFSLISATEYLHEAMSIFDRDTIWDNHYDLALDLFSSLAELGECTGDFDQSTGEVNEILTRAKTPHDKMRAYHATMETLMSTSQLKDCIAVGYDVLDLLGEKIPRRPNSAHVALELIRALRLVRGKTAADFLALPRSQDKTTINTLKTLDLMAFTAYLTQTSKNVFSIATLRLVRLSCKRGITEHSIFGFACFAVLQSFLGKTHEALKYGQITLELINKLTGSKALESRAFFGLYHLVFPWGEAFEDVVAGFRQGYQAGMATGDTFSGFACAGGVIVLDHHLGRPLWETDERMHALCHQFKQYGQEEAMRTLLPFWQIVINLRGHCADPSELSGEAIDLLNDLQNDAEKDSGAGRLKFSAKLALAYYFEDWDHVEYLLPLLETKYQPVKAHCFSVSQGAFAAGMCYLQLARLMEGYRRKKYLNMANRKIKSMKKWVKDGGVNCRPPLMIMMAERSSMKKKEGVIQQFERAAQAAAQMGFLQQEAIAYERAASHLKKTKSQSFIDYVQKAMEIYNEWGAQAKVTMLEQKFNLKSTQPLPDDGAADLLGVDVAINGPLHPLD